MMKLAGLCVVCVLGATAHAQQQEATITGRVTVAGTNAPLAAARVIAVGTPSTALTEQDGRYTLKHLAPGRVDVQVLAVGYLGQKRGVVATAASAATADFQLSVTVAKLADVVSTATGEQRKIELGYATASLDNIGVRMEQSPTTLSVGDLLVQRAPGVDVIGQGMIGTASTIRIRGLSSVSLTNEPIVFVDGSRVSSIALNPGAGVGGTQTSLLNSFSPEEIETIDIMKGPAAASVYGTNAANGVIVITTKKGRVGASRWTWTAEQGRIADENDYPSSFAIWGHAPNTTAPIRCLLATMGPTSCLQDSVTSLNILKDDALSPINTGNRSLWGMQASGGTDAVRFFVAANIENALGPIQMPGFAYNRLDSMKIAVRGEWKNPEALQRENFRANFNASLSPSLELGVSAGFIKSDQRFPQSDNSPVSLFAAARSGPGFAHAGLGYTNVGALGEPLNGYNAWVPSEIFQDLSTQDVQRETLTGNTTWRARSWMQNEATLGIDYASFTDFNVCRLNECPAFSNLRTGSNFSSTTGTRMITARVSSMSTWDARPGLNLRTTVGSQWVYDETDNSSAVGFGLPPGAQNVGQAANRLTASNFAPLAGRTLGVFLQEQAAYHDRVFVTVGLRSDQNSAFGPSQTWAHYPMANASWLLSDETFFPKFSWLDQFRARAAFGASGRQPNATTAFKTYKPVISSIGGTDQRGLVADQVGNPDLKPERTTESELGFDARVLQNRVNAEITYFRKNTTNAIVTAPIAASSTAGSLLQSVNAGSVQNSGLEGTITAQLADRLAFGWDVTLTASHLTNKVKSMGPTGTLKFGNTWLAEGYPVDALFYRPFAFSDANSDGRIQQSEVAVDTTMRFVGYQTPRDLVSLQNGFTMFSRRLHVTALLDYKSGHSMFDGSSAFLCQQYSSCPDESDPSATLAEQARNVANRYGTVVGSTTFRTGIGYLSNAQFWRLREIAATLTLPQHFTDRILRASNASLTFGVRNVHVWTSYSGVDPESNFGAGDIQNDFMTAGPPRYYNLRLSLHY